MGEQESRVKKTLLNARVNLFFYFITLLLSFFSRKIFLDTLGADFQTILVMHMRLANTDYFTREGLSDANAIKTLLRKIEIGLWDNYLFFEFESFQNIKAQSNLANAVQMALTSQQMMNNK